MPGHRARNSGAARRPWSVTNVGRIPELDTSEEEKPMSAPNTGTSKRGIDLLHDPKLNKSTGFTEAERQALGLVGLVPDATESIDPQLTRVVLQLEQTASELRRFI